MRPPFFFLNIFFSCNKDVLKHLTATQVCHLNAQRLSSSSIHVIINLRVIVSR